MYSIDFVFGTIACFIIAAMLYGIINSIIGYIRKKKKYAEQRMKKEHDDAGYLSLCSRYNDHIDVNFIVAPDRMITLYQNDHKIGVILAIRDLEKNGKLGRYVSIFSGTWYNCSLDKKIGLDIPIDSPILKELKDTPAGFVTFRIRFVLCVESRAFEVIEGTTFDNCIIVSVNRTTGTMNLLAKSNGKIIATMLIERCFKREIKEMFIYIMLTMKSGYSNIEFNTGLSRIESNIYGFGYDYITIGCNFDPKYVDTSTYYDYDY